MIPENTFSQKPNNNPKKHGFPGFLLKTAFLAVFAFAFSLVFCMIVDPYNVFHVNDIRDNGVEINKNYVKMSYILENPDRFDAFMFGSSRVGSIHAEKIPDIHCYNMTYSQGLPAEHLANLRTMLSHGIRPKRVYMGVDETSFTYDPVSHYTKPVRIPYEQLKGHPLTFCRTYLNAAMTFNALPIILNSTPGYKTAEYFYAYGVYNFYDGATLADSDTPISAPPKGDANRPDETLKEIAQMVELCRENNIELIIFTNPQINVTYASALESGYINFLRGLARVTPYYNFSGINAISNDPGCFVDSSHYTPEVGDIMLQTLCYEKTDPGLYARGFGWYVTSENVEEFLQVLTAP